MNRNRFEAQFTRRSSHDPTRASSMQMTITAKRRFTAGTIINSGSNTTNNTGC